MPPKHTTPSHPPNVPPGPQTDKPKVVQTPHHRPVVSTGSSSNNPKNIQTPYHRPVVSTGPLSNNLKNVQDPHHHQGGSHNRPIVSAGPSSNNPKNVQAHHHHPVVLTGPSSNNPKNVTNLPLRPAVLTGTHSGGGGGGGRGGDGGGRGGGGGGRGGGGSGGGGSSGGDGGGGDNGGGSDEFENISLYDSFFHPLPSLPEASDKKDFNNSYSSATTGYIVPPAYWEEVPVAHYLEKAHQALRFPKAKRYLEARFDLNLDPLLRMRVEADVVRWGDEHLAFHVNHALYARFSTIMESFSEYEIDKCRPDKVWRRRHNAEDRQHECVALFESKIKNAIVEDELKAAKLFPGEDPQQKIEGALEKGWEKGTYFQGKSLKIMSQIAKYSRSTYFNTNYVALFDSKHLFLCVFDRQDPSGLKATLVPCQEEGNNLARRALLGWLIEAWEKELAGENSHAPPHPDDIENERKAEEKKAAKEAAKGHGDGAASTTAGSGSKPTKPTKPTKTVKISKENNPRN